MVSTDIRIFFTDFIPKLCSVTVFRYCVPQLCSIAVIKESGRVLLHDPDPVDSICFLKRMSGEWQLP